MQGKVSEEKWFLYDFSIFDKTKLDRYNILNDILSTKNEEW